MAEETKAQIAEERDRLREENERLRGQLSSVIAAGGPAATAHRFQLSEGDRSELAIHGRVSIGGKLLNRAEVRELLGDDQKNVDLGDGE